MIEPPAPRSSRPAPTVQRRSRPVKGSVLADAFAGCVPVAGALLELDGATVLDGVVEVPVGVFVDFDGEVPLFGEVVAGVVVAGVVVAGVVVAGVVGVVVGGGGGVV
jgi:hypothetical protein